VRSDLAGHARTGDGHSGHRLTDKGAVGVEDETVEVVDAVLGEP
jgi:hypothetical protein